MILVGTFAEIVGAAAAGTMRTFCEASVVAVAAVVAAASMRNCYYDSTNSRRHLLACSYSTAAADGRVAAVAAAFDRSSSVATDRDWMALTCETMTMTRKAVAAENLTIAAAAALSSSSTIDVAVSSSLLSVHKRCPDAIFPSSRYSRSDRSATLTRKTSWRRRAFVESSMSMIVRREDSFGRPKTMMSEIVT